MSWPDNRQETRLTEKALFAWRAVDQPAIEYDHAATITAFPNVMRDHVYPRAQRVDMKYIGIEPCGSNQTPSYRN